MTNDMIAKFCEKEKLKDEGCMRIDFKKRDSIFGFIVEGKDYEELKSKNFWRIVSCTNIKSWQASGNLDFAKIYNGMEITKLSVVANAMHVKN